MRWGLSAHTLQCRREKRLLRFPHPIGARLPAQHSTPRCLLSTLQMRRLEHNSGTFNRRLPKEVSSAAMQQDSRPRPGISPAGRCVQWGSTLL
eukprot:XP_001707393.1 Hypothetical protein GL50803_23790 [Giardia lamblia ATCC 50803]